MARLKNEQLILSGDAASENAIQFRADNCKCGATQCDYTAEVSAAVTVVDLGGDFDGNVLDLPEASYAVSAPGAAALEADLKVLLDGVAENVEVVYTDAGTDTLTVTVTNSIIVLKELNNTVFTASNCGGTGE